MVAGRMGPERVAARAAGKERQAGRAPALRGDEIRALRELQRQTNGPYVFQTERGGPYTTDAVNRQLKRIAANAGFPAGHVHFHMLRPLSKPARPSGRTGPCRTPHDAKAATGTFTISNCKFVCGTSLRQFQFIQLDIGCAANFVFNYNDVDGQAVQGNYGGTSGSGPDIRCFGTGSVTMKYNRFYNMEGRIALYGLVGFFFQFNYCEGQGYWGTIHGEWMIFNAGPGSITIPLIRVSY
jgi:hypothetical protein